MILLLCVSVAITVTKGKEQVFLIPIKFRSAHAFRVYSVRVMSVWQQAKQKFRQHWWGVSTATALAAVLVVIGWGVHDFLSTEPAGVRLTAKLQEFGTVYWHPVDISDVVWGDPLSFQAEVKGKALTFIAEYGGRLHMKINCLQPTLEKWGLYQHNGLLARTEVLAPSLELQVSDPVTVRVDMSEFNVLGVVYHLNGPILDVRNTAKDQSTSAQVIGVSGQPFNLLFEKGYEGAQGTPAGPITLTDGKLTTPLLPFALTEAQEELIVLVTSEAKGYEISSVGPMKPENRVRVIAANAGNVKVHTKVRWVSFGENPGELEIEGKGVRFISREEKANIGLVGTPGGELYLSTHEAVLDVTGTASTVLINGAEQLANKLDGWRWYRQYLIAGLALSSLLGLLGRRYLLWRHGGDSVLAGQNDA